MNSKNLTYLDILNLLPYGKDKALSSADIYMKTDKKIDLNTFKRRLRTLSHEARKEGHWVIGDEKGYYMAMNKAEWDRYKIRRFRAIKDELESIANCDRLSTQDLIKLVYLVKVDDPNYTLNF
jgi:hypothetical protein